MVFPFLNIQLDLKPTIMLLCSGLIVFSVILIGFFILYKTSKDFRFKAKYFTYNCAMIVLPMYGLFLGFLRPRDVNNFHRFALPLYNISSKLFKIYVECKGTENLDREKVKSNFVIVSNHQSSLDMLAVMKICPPNTTFVAKRELLFAPVFGLAAWLCGAVFVRRGDHKSARHAMDEAVERIKSQKMNLWIFPEGTRRQEGTLLPFKKGAFHVAQQAQIPVIPVVIADYIPIFNKKNKTFSSGTLTVTILPPVSTQGLTPDDVGDLTEKVRQQMLEVFHEGSIVNGIQNDSKLKSKSE